MANEPPSEAPNHEVSEDDKNQIILARLANGEILRQDDGMFLFACPHCSLAIVVNPQDIACQQFVHAVAKDTGQGVNPHASLEECTRLLQLDAVRASLLLQRPRGARAHARVKQKEKREKEKKKKRNKK